jgi:hypothetical protein
MRTIGIAKVRIASRRVGGSAAHAFKSRSIRPLPGNATFVERVGGKPAHPTNSNHIQSARAADHDTSDPTIL